MNKSSVCSQLGTNICNEIVIYCICKSGNESIGYIGANNKCREIFFATFNFNSIWSSNVYFLLKLIFILEYIKDIRYAFFNANAIVLD